MTQEQAFLSAILQKPDDDVSKLVYADWLEEQGDPRGELLRGVVELRRRRSINPEQRARHQELAAEMAKLNAESDNARESGQALSIEDWERQERLRQVDKELEELSQQARQAIPPRLQQLAATFDPQWLAVVSDPEIEVCGRRPHDRFWFMFNFVCENSWSDLKQTSDPTVRHCDGCQKNVYFCDNLVDAREHAECGHCIAVDLGIIRRKGDLEPPTLMVVGEPSEEALQQLSLESLDPVSLARLDTRNRQKKKRWWWPW